MSAYLLHLGWMVPVILLQWVLAGRILLRNRKPILLTVAAIGTYYWLTDVYAVDAGIWDFDPEAITGIRLFGLPIEEILFFYMTSLLVAQSIVMFLPDRERY